MEGSEKKNGIEKIQRRKKKLKKKLKGINFHGKKIRVELSRLEYKIRNLLRKNKKKTSWNNMNRKMEQKNWRETEDQRERENRTRERERESYLWELHNKY